MSHPSSKYRPDAFSGILISQTGNNTGVVSTDLMHFQAS